MSKSQVRDKAEVRKAKDRAHDYCRTVVKEEVEELIARLPEALKAHAVQPKEGGRTWYQEFTIELSVDGRCLPMDPENPLPDVRRRKYKINFKPQGCFGNESTYRNKDEPSKWKDEVEIHTWGAATYGYPRDEWNRVDSEWHRLQVLRSLCKVDPKELPGTQKGAILSLLRFAQDHFDLLDEEQKTAVTLLQGERLGKTVY